MEPGTGREGVGWSSKPGRGSDVGDGGAATTGRVAAAYGGREREREQERACVGRESETAWSDAVSLNRLISDDVSDSCGM